MSAATDVPFLQHYFQNFSLGFIDLERRRKHGLTLSYADGSFLRSLTADMCPEKMAEALELVVQQHHVLRDLQQSFLVFLPGRQEVHALADRLTAVTSMQVQRLFGGQALHLQQRALRFRANGSKRLVILATDVVESSVTIPTVDLVIDTCLHRRRRWHPLLKESPLTLEFISQDEALQRSGRTARLRDGHAFRCITEMEFGRLQRHAEPEIRHHPLDSLVLAVYGFRGLSRAPEDFLAAMPSPPDLGRVKSSISRLEELGALGSDGRLTAVGRLLDQLPLDSGCGMLVINGLRYDVVADCCVMAAILQQGSPFEAPVLDDGAWDMQRALQYWHVRNVCADCDGYPSDLLQDLAGYRAWCRQVQSAGAAWAIDQGPQWCMHHFLSFERLQSIDEVKRQILVILHQHGYEVPAMQSLPMQCNQRQRGDRLASCVPEFAGDPCTDFKELLSWENQEASHRRLLQWCIAASFIHGMLSMQSSACTEQVSFTARRNKKEQVGPFLAQHGFQIEDVAMDNSSGKVTITFGSREEARRACQVVAAGTNSTFPFRSAEQRSWGRQRRQQVQLRGSSSLCKLKAESMVEPQVREDCEVITADALPVKTGRGFMYLCSKNTMVPSGLLPLVVLATYCKQEAQQCASSPLEFKLKVRFHGSWEEFSLQAHDLRVFSAIEEVRKNMDKEFGPHISLTQRKQITVERAASVRRMMDQLHGGEPPVRSVVRPSEDFLTSLLPSLNSLGLQF